MIQLTITRLFVFSTIFSFVFAQNIEIDQQQTNIRRRLETDGIKNAYTIQQVNTHHEKINMNIDTEEDNHRILYYEDDDQSYVRVKF